MGGPSCNFNTPLDPCPPPNPPLSSIIQVMNAVEAKKFFTACSCGKHARWSVLCCANSFRAAGQLMDSFVVVKVAVRI